jgi:hypothetical protein
MEVGEAVDDLLDIEYRVEATSTTIGENTQLKNILQ